MNPNNLIVPQGTSSSRMAQFSSTPIENGWLLNKVMLVQEAGKPMMQIQTSTYYKTLKEVLAELNANVE